MRIAYVCADAGIPLRGNKGASVHMRSLAAALAGRGHDLTLVCRSLDGNNPLPPGVKVEALPADEGDHRRWLSSLFASSRIEVVLERYSLGSGPAQTAARALGIIAVLEVNARLVEEAARYRGLEDVARWRRRERRILGDAERVVAVSESIRQHAIACGASPESVEVVPNGVNRAAFTDAPASAAAALRRRYGLADQLVVGFVGSLKAWHGVATLVRALAISPEGKHLLVVGDGRQRSELEATIRAGGLDSYATFIGAVPHAEIPAYMAAMDVGVAPYDAQPDFYFSPLKVAEYLAAGLPVVASDQGQIRDLVGDAGLVVAPGDAPAVALALHRLWSDPDLREQMSRAAPARVRDLDWDNIAARVEGLLQAPARAA